MTPPARETWTVRFLVPVGRYSGRYFAAFLKHLGRRWNIVAEQITEAPPDPTATHQTTQAASGAAVDSAGREDAGPLAGGSADGDEAGDEAKPLFEADGDLDSDTTSLFDG
jgi:hypothetical protein